MPTGGVAALVLLQGGRRVQGSRAGRRYSEKRKASCRVHWARSVPDGWKRSLSGPGWKMPIRCSPDRGAAVCIVENLRPSLGRPGVVPLSAWCRCLRGAKFSTVARQARRGAAVCVVPLSAWCKVFDRRPAGSGVAPLSAWCTVFDRRSAGQAWRRCLCDAIAEVSWWLSRRKCPFLPLPTICRRLCCCWPCWR